MKLRIFTFMLLFTFAAQAAKQAPKGWKLADTIEHEDCIQEIYHRIDGPSELPLDIKALAWFGSSKFCCCRKWCNKQVENHKHSCLETIEKKPGANKASIKQYFFYK